MTTDNKVIPNPYVGLRNFKQKEGAIFFGRDEQIKQLIELLENLHFVSIVGGSGCGKSSLVRAGLLYNLSGELSQEHKWKFIKMRPTFPKKNPFENLLSSLNSPALNLDLGNLSKDSLKDSEFFQGFLYKNPQPDNIRLLILVDQFEEIFKFYKDNKEEATQFVNLLLRCSQHSTMHVVITLRADLLGECAHFPNLVEAVTESIFVVPHLGEEQLRAVIEKPATEYQAQVEEKLVNTLISDMANDPSRLPLLQHALRYLWDRLCYEKNSQKILELEDYEKIKAEMAEWQIKYTESQTTKSYSKLLDYLSIFPYFRRVYYRNQSPPKKTKPWDQHPLALVLSHHANRIYRGLSIPHKDQKVVRALFRSITERNSEDRIDTRRSVTLETFLHPIDSEQPTKDIKGAIERVIRTFHKRNFIIYYNPPHDKCDSNEGKKAISLPEDTSITISHESLIGGWNQLHQWVDEEATAAYEYKSIRHSAERWEKNKSFSSLARGIQLEIWRAWWKREKPTVAWAKRYDRDDGSRFRLAEEFLNASRDYEVRRIVINCMIVVMTGLSVWGWHSYSSGENQLDQAIFLGLNKDYQHSQHYLKNSEFNLKSLTSASYQNIRKLLMQLNLISWGEALKTEFPSATFLNTVTTSADGKLLGMGGEKGTLILQNAQNKLQLSGHKDTVRAIAFAPKNQWMVSSGDDQQIILWSLPEGKQIRVWKASNKVWSIAISPDEKYIATGGRDNVITLWVADTGEIVKEFKGDKDDNQLEKGISALIFAHSGEYLISASYDKTVRLWKLKTGEDKKFSGHAGKVQRLALSPNGKLLATSSSDRTILLWNMDWNIDTVQVEKILFGHQDTVFGVEFTADGNYLASSSADRTVRLWDVKSGVPVRVLQGHTAMVTDLAIRDKQIITVGADKTIKWWDANLPNQHYNSLPDAAISTAIAPDGEKVAVGFKDGMVRVYALSEPQTLLWESSLETQHSKTVQRLAWSADGQWLASASSDTTIKLWHADGRLERTLNGHEYTVRAVIFSPDNRFLISIGLDGKIGTFKLDSTEKNLVVKNESKQELNSIEFDQSGTKLLIASDDAVYQFAFNQQSGELTLVQTYSQKPRDTITWAAFSPNAQQYASVGRDGLIQIHDLNSQSTVPKTLVGHQTTILRAKFSPDNKQLITVSGDATVRFWDLDGNRELFTLNLPTNSGKPEPLWDFDFRCTPNGCFIAVPLTHGRLAWYELGKIY